MSTVRAGTCRCAAGLTGDTLHLWTAQLDEVGTHRAELLSEPERRRAERILRPQARARWVAARVFLRSLLGAYLDTDPHEVPLVTQPSGKPALAPAASGATCLPGGEPAPAQDAGQPALAPAASRPLGVVDPRLGELRFSLSHSGGLAMCALTRMCAVGCDLQLPPPPGRLPAVAGRAFGERRAQALCALPPPTREQRLLSAWVRFEAERKRTGAGLAPAHPGPAGPRPWIAGIPLGLPGAAAVALARPPARLRVAPFTLVSSPAPVSFAAHASSVALFR